LKLHEALIQRVPNASFHFSIQTMKRAMHQLETTLRVDKKQFVTCTICDVFKKREQAVYDKPNLDRLELQLIANN
jgi:hypothetical protein